MYFARMPVLLLFVFQSVLPQGLRVGRTPQAEDLQRPGRPPAEIESRVPPDPPVFAREAPPAEATIDATEDGRLTVSFSLSPGLSLISMPIRMTSRKLADIFPGLPEGSRVWTWDPSAQDYVEGFDRELAPGQACWLDVPAPTTLVVSGEANTSPAIGVQLYPGWNLIGVPYTQPLFIGMQTVAASQLRTGVADAMDVRMIGRQIFTADSAGYSRVDANGSFDASRGYWLYSTSPQVLELAPLSLRLPGGEGGSLWGMGLKWAGSGLVSWGVGFGLSTLLTSMGIGAEAATQAKLNEIIDQLNKVIETQKYMIDQLNELSNTLEIDTNRILVSIGDTVLVGPVRTNVKTHYDDAGTAYASLKWFTTKAVSDTDRASVSETSKSMFAWKVLNDWNFEYSFNSINTAIIGSSSTVGVLDAFADQINAETVPGTLKDHYDMLQAYFNQLIGLQLKCGTLVMNAYTQLAAHPYNASPYQPGDALYWKQTTFDPTIKDEINRFKTVVERLAVARLVLPDPDGAQAHSGAQAATAATQPSVTMPDEVKNMLWSLDYLLMNMLDEPEGLRIRMIVNPDFGPPRLQWKESGFSMGTNIAVPPVSEWDTVPGKRMYDSWGYTGTYPHGTRQLNVTSSWKVKTVILSPAQAITYRLALLNNWAWWDMWWQMGLAHERVTPGTYDVDGDPATPAQTFGSTTIVNRLDANEILDPRLSDTVPWANNCGGNATTDPASSQAQLKGNGLSISGFITCDAGVGVSMPFTYVGADKTVRWWAHASWSSPLYHSSYHLQLLEGSTVMGWLWEDEADGWLHVPSATFVRGHTYTYYMAIQTNGSMFPLARPELLTPKNVLIAGQ